MAEQGIPVLIPAATTGASASIPIIGAALAPGALTWGALAVPVIGAAIAGVSLAIGLWLNRKGPRQKEATTKIVNEAEDLMRQNIAAWNASEKNALEKEQYLKNFYGIWQVVVDSCASDALGSPGHSCIEDRMPEGMVLNVAGKQYVGNGKWNWFQYYFDPVNSYVVQETSGNFGINNLFSGGFNPSGIGIFGGVLLAGIGLVLVLGSGD